MSTQPVMPHRLMTVAEYLEIGEVEPGYTELVEGRLILSPSPTHCHSRGGSRLWKSLDAQLPPEFEAVQDIDVDLELAPASAPGTCRRPDVVVVGRTASDRIDRDGGCTGRRTSYSRSRSSRRARGGWTVY